MLLSADRLSRLPSISALAWSDVAVSQSEGSEKLSVREVAPRPGRISGVGGFGLEKAPSVGVAEAGNQTMVAVGCGVSVKIIGAGVAFNASRKAQELISNVMVSAVPARKSEVRYV